MSETVDAGDAVDTDERELLDEVEQTLVGRPELTRKQIAEQAGVSVEVASNLWHALGFAHVDDTATAFTEADARALAQAKELIDLGVLDQDSMAALVRTWGRSFARLAEWQTVLLTGVVAGADDPESAIGELTETVLPDVADLQAWIWRRHLLSAAGRMLGRPSDGADGAVRTVGFVDIVGYTSRSKELRDDELVALVEHFEEVSTSVVTDAGGQIVKTIGDEVLFVVDDPLEAVRVALTLTGRHEEDEAYPEVRGGLAYGSVVDRLGDVFGPTVNIASRLTSLARPGSVVVDRGVHDAIEERLGEDQREYRLHRLRRTSVKGYSHLDSWRLRERAGED